MKIFLIFNIFFIINNNIYINKDNNYNLYLLNLFIVYFKMKILL